MKVVGYIRVSTGEQADLGVSLEAQREKLELFARLHGHELLEIVEDRGESAKTLDRPGAARVLGMLQSGAAEGLLVYKLDRLTRSVRDLGELIDDYFGERSRHGATLLSVRDSIDTSSATGRLMLNLLGSVAQWEREVIAERTREVLAHKRRRGERVGNIPYGYRLAADGVQLEADPAEAAAVATARALRRRGESFRQIARALDELGHKRRNGRPWHPDTVRRMTAEARR